MGAIENLRDGDWNGVRQNFNLVGRLLGLLGADGDGFGFKVAGVGVRFGTTTFTFTAATNSAGVNQAHGLGKTPSIVLMGGWWVATGTRLGTAHVIEPGLWDATQFPCIATVQGAAYTGTATAGWVVIG